MVSVVLREGPSAEETAAERPLESIALLPSNAPR